ncbi:MAG TPA: DnaJ domain-containing protein [Pyrinomonadaceae bacterium]|jgi:curved DNA-binding protein CbpA|nr:DnaJ domain-containing protein [Pyrinomonadaceae bacterium]
MNGQLFEHPFAELIHEIAAAGLSGSLRLARERVKLVVYFEEGGIVYATSNLRAHRLSECARRWGVAPVQQLASEREKMSDMELGLELIARGELSREEFEDLLARQAIEVLRPALLWTDGEWSFDARVRLTVDFKAQVDARELLMECARRLPHDFVAGRFSRTAAAGAGEKLSPVPVATNGLKLSPVEAFVLSRVDAPMALFELTAISGMPETDTLQALYALVLGGLLKRDAAPRAFNADQLARARSVKTPQVRHTPAEAKPTPEPAAPEAPKAPPPPSEAEMRQNEVDILFARLGDAQNHYQVLDLSRDAEAGEIKRAYHTLAKRFHPDRFHRDADPSLYARIEDAFARISQAYETLKDQQTRAAYDRALGPMVVMRPKEPAAAPTQKKQQQEEKPQQKGAPKPSPASGASMPWGRPASAAAVPEEIYQQGAAAFQQGNQTLALSYLGEAARLAPKQARYRAQYGRALAVNQQTRHQAEAEFQAAIALDKENVYYRVMLARLYSEMGMQRRAQSELERALAIDPQSQAARLMLDKLRGKG